MNYQSRLIKLVLPLIIIFLAACEGHVDREWRVDNTSGSDLKLKASLVNSSDTMYLLIGPGKNLLITITSEDKGNSLPQQAYEVFTFMQIRNGNNDTLHINYLDNKNWDIWIEKVKSRPDRFEQVYTLIVNESDF